MFVSERLQLLQLQLAERAECLENFTANLLQCAKICFLSIIQLFRVKKDIIKSSSHSSSRAGDGLASSASKKYCGAQ